MPPTDPVGVDRRRELAEFLRTRRGRVRPPDVGLATAGRRRVPGLRRDEVARRASMSVEYYTRLEQGRGGRPSDEVLDALAQALQLDPAAREHLFRLAVPPHHPTLGARTDATGTGTGSGGDDATGTGIRPGVAAVVAAMSHTPVVVVDRRLDVLATNRLGSALFAGPPGEARAHRDVGGPDGTGLQNCAMSTFLDPAMRRFYLDWDAVARDVVGLLRRLTGQHPLDARLHGLVTELLARSDEFRALWAAHDVRQRLHGRKRMRHPVVGEIALDYEHLAVPDDPGIALTVFTAPERSDARRALARLERAAREPAALP
jgi:transcriptional regulator with XRE-family HTH domain